MPNIFNSTCRDRKEHGDGMFSIEPDPWTQAEKDRSIFYKICQRIETLEKEQREAKLEKVRARRRLRLPGDPLFDRKMRKKVNCLNKDCRQGYRSVSRQRGICPECREKEAKRLAAEACKYSWKFRFFWTRSNQNLIPRS